MIVINLSKFAIWKKLNLYAIPRYQLTTNHSFDSYHNHQDLLLTSLQNCLILWLIDHCSPWNSKNSYSITTSYRDLGTMGCTCCKNRTSSRGSRQKLGQVPTMQYYSKRKPQRMFGIDVGNSLQSDEPALQNRLTVCVCQTWYSKSYFYRLTCP